MKWKWLFLNGYECQKPIFYRDRIFELPPSWNKRISLLGIFVANISRTGRVALM